MASIAGILDQALRTANIPIIGVALGDPANRATWSVLFLPAATPADRVNAQTIIDTIVVDAAALLDADATAEIDTKDLRATAQALWECIPAPTKTLVQLRARAIAIRKTL